MEQAGESHAGTRRRPVRIVAAALVLGALAIGAALLWPRRVGNPLNEGTAAYRAADYSAASRIARARLQTNNRDQNALRLLARSSLRLGDEARAESLYKSLGDEALEGEDFYLLGLSQHERGDLAGAVQSWELGAAKDPGHCEMLAILAQSLGELDRFTPAVLVIRQLLSQPGESPRANRILGNLYEMMNASEQAVVALERGLAREGTPLAPAEASRVVRQLAHNLLRTGRPAEARRVLTQDLDSASPGDPETQWLLARCDLQEGKPSDATTQQSATAFREASPMIPEPSPYVGAAACAKCHRSNFTSQQQSRHGRTFFTASQVRELPFLPGEAVPDPGNSQVRHSYRKVDSHLEVDTRIQDRLVRTIVDYAFGSGDRGLTLVGHDDRNHLFESRLSYYSKHGGWDVTSGQATHPGEEISYQGSLLNLDVVRRCILCHQTNPMAVLTNTGPEASDPAIGCEKCHGPGGHHLRIVESSAITRDLAIARPSLARGEPVIRLCGECHDPRKTDAQLSPLSETAIRFQASSLMWSRCFQQSDKQLDCVTCHNPHRDAETDPRFYEQKCLGCHTGTASSATLAMPKPDAPGVPHVAGKACPVQPRTGCVSCHMPRDQTSIPHSEFTDHFIRVRRDRSAATEVGGRQ